MMKMYLSATVESSKKTIMRNLRYVQVLPLLDTIFGVQLETAEAIDPSIDIGASCVLDSKVAIMSLLADIDFYEKARA